MKKTPTKESRFSYEYKGDPHDYGVQKLVYTQAHLLWNALVGSPSPLHKFISYKFSNWMPTSI